MWRAHNNDTMGELACLFVTYLLCGALSHCVFYCGFSFLPRDRRRYASAVLGSRNSARPCDTRVLCDKTKQCTADILILHERAITLLFWHQQWLVGNTDFCLKFALKVTHPLFEKRRLRQISAYNVSTVRNSEKRSIMTNRKSTTSFPMSYRLSA